MTYLANENALPTSTLTVVILLVVLDAKAFAESDWAV